MRAVILASMLFLGSFLAGQEIRRPTADADGGGASCSGYARAGAALPYAYDDAGASTYSSEAVSGPIGFYYDNQRTRQVYSWSSASAPYAALSLGITSTCTANQNNGDAYCSMAYSTDGGASWSQISAYSYGWSGTTMIGLSSSQDLTQLLVSFCVSGKGPGGDDPDLVAGYAQVDVYDVWTEGTLLPPPAAPGAASAAAINAGRIDLTWQDNADNETNYRVQRCTGSGCSAFSDLVTLGVNATSYSDTSVAASTAYSYRIYAYNAAGNSGFSNTASATTPLAAPTNLSASAAGTQIQISWTDNASGESGYQIQRCTGNGCAGFSNLTTVGANVTSYVDAGLAADTYYTYQVYAYNANGQSGNSNSATAGTIPSAPSGLAAVGVSNSQITLTWTNASVTESGFKVQRCAGLGCSNFADGGAAGASATTYDDTGLSPNASYTYRVYAYNSAGNSGNSNWASATTPEFTISTPFVTLYQYDALDRLTCVEQHGDVANSTGCTSDPSYDVTSSWRVRRFAYDSLSRLTSASNPESRNPESRAINYYYTTAEGALCSGNPADVCRKTDARNITATYSYDGLNRLTDINYSDGTQNASYTYDSSSVRGTTVENPIGRRVLAAAAGGTITTIFSYDELGRTKKTWQCVPGGPDCKTVTYEYNRGGSVHTLTDPAGRIFTYSYDDSGRLASVADNSGTTYASGAVYAPHGALAGFSNAAGVSVTNTFNPRLQPREVSAARSGSKILDLVYDFHLGSGDTGDVYQISNQLDGSRTQYFAYDQLGRLLQAQTSLTWGNSYQYDPWGNLLQKNAVANTQSGEYLQKQVGVDNRFLGEVYDAAGNLTRGLYAYDAENRLVNAGGIGYTYDADGRRVQKQNGPVYWYGAQGEVLAESDASGAITNEYVFFGGRRIARRDSNANSFYYLEDHLGTARKITTSDGVCYDADYFPYGAEQHVYVDTCPQNYKFTGKERDGETGLDYFGARYYGSTMGRFMQADPLYIEMRRLGDPQRLNLYQYTRNNPLTFVDPTGLDVKLNCDTGTNCNTAVADLNKRKGARFNVSLGKGNVLKADKLRKAQYNKLSPSEKALYNAIRDTSNHATINVSGNTGQSEFGVHNSPGVNSVDLGNLSRLDAPSNAGGLNSGDVLAHEAMDAYYSLSRDEGAADSAASLLFPGLLRPTNNQNMTDQFQTQILGSTFDQAITNGSGTERISIQYITPIPAIDLFGKTPLQKSEVAHDAGSRVTGVTFVPPKQ